MIYTNNTISKLNEYQRLINAEVTTTEALATTGLSAATVKAAKSNGILTVSEGVKSGAIKSSTKAILAQTAAWATSPMGMATIAITGISLLISGIKAYNQKVQESRQELMQLGQQAADTNKQLSELIEQYRKLGEDGKIDLSDQETAKGIQSQIVDLVKDHAGNLDLVNGKYDEEIENLREIAALEAVGSESKAYDAKKSAEETLIDKGNVTATAGAWESTSEAKKIKEVMQKHGFQDYMGENGYGEKVLPTFVVDNSSAENAIKSYEEMIRLKELLYHSYYDEIQAGGELEDFYNSLNTQITNMADAVDKYKQAAHNYELNQAVQIFYNATDYDGKKQADELGIAEGSLIKSKEEFDAYISSIENSDKISDGIKDDLIELANSTFPQFSKAAKDAGENANKMTVSIGDLEKASDNIKTLGSAFKELSEDGYITTKTLGEIQTATGLSGDEWEDYKTKLLNAKAGSAEFNQIMSDMTVKILDNAFAGRDLTSVTEDEIEAILRENGVVNASAIAKEYKARATLQAKLAEADYSNGIDAVVSALGSECKALGLTEQEVKDLATMYASAQQAMLDAVETGASARLNILKSELEGITGIAEAYALLGRGYDANGDGVNDYSAEEMDEMSAEDLKKYRADSAKIIAYGNAVEALKKIQEIDIDVPNYSGNTKDSGSDNKPDYEDPTDAIINRINLRADELEQQEEEIQNLIEIAELENDYKKQISLTNDLIATRKKRVDELNAANAGLHSYAEELRNSTSNWSEEEWFDSQGNATEAYNNFINSRIKAGASKEEIEAIKDQFEKISKIKKAWVENDEETVSLNKGILQDAEKLNELYVDLHNNVIGDIEHARDMTLEADPFADTTSYYKQLQEEYHKEAERLRALDPEKYKEEIQELQQAWWDAEKSIKDSMRDAMDTSIDSIDRYIEARKFYNDWEDFGDTESDAIKRKIAIVKKYYAEGILSLREYNDTVAELEQEMYDSMKQKALDALDFQSSQTSSLHALTQSYFNVINNISEAQHDIDKELQSSKTMYEYLDRDLRELLFNQKDYNILSGKLLDIQSEAEGLQKRFNNEIQNATKKNLEEITSQYQMQYETLLKSYEIAKADLEIAKKKQKLNNVLKEKNVRMFINGQWRYVANTQDVIDAQNELSDARYSKTRADADLAQTTSLNQIQTAQDVIGTAAKGIENGLVDFRGTVDEMHLKLGEVATVDAPVLQSIVSQTSTSIATFLQGLRDAKIESPISYSEDFDYSEAIAYLYNSGLPLDSSIVQSLDAEREAKILGENVKRKPLLDVIYELTGKKVVTSNDLIYDFLGGNLSSNNIAYTTTGSYMKNSIDQMAKLWNTNGIYASSLKPVTTANNASPQYFENNSINGVTISDVEGRRIVKELTAYIKNNM